MYISKILLLYHCLQFFFSHFSIRIFPLASAIRIRHPHVSGPRFTDTRHIICVLSAFFCFLSESIDCGRKTLERASISKAVPEIEANAVIYVHAYLHTWILGGMYAPTETDMYFKTLE